MSAPNGNGNGNGNGATTRVDPAFFSVSAAPSPNPTPAITLPPADLHDINHDSNDDGMDVDSSADDNPFQSAQDALGPAAATGLAATDLSAASSSDSTAKSSRTSKRSASKKSSTTTTPTAKTSKASKRPASSPASSTSAATESTSTPPPDQPPKSKRAKYSSTLKVGEAWADPSSMPVPLLDQVPDLSLGRGARRSAVANLNYNVNTLSDVKTKAAFEAAAKEAERLSAMEVASKLTRAERLADKGNAEHGEAEDEEEPVKAAKKGRASAGSKSKGKGNKGKAKAKASAEPADPEMPSSDQPEPAEGDQEHQDEDEDEKDADAMDVDQEYAPQPVSKSKKSKKSAPSKSKSKAKSTSAAATKRSTRRSATLAASYADPTTEDEADAEDSVVNITSSSARTHRRRSINSSATALEVAAASADSEEATQLPPTRTYARGSRRAGAGASRTSSAASLTGADADPMPAPVLPNAEKMVKPVAALVVVADGDSELSDLDDDEHQDVESVDSEVARERVSLQPLQAPMETTRSRHSRNKQIRNSSAPTSPVMAGPSTRRTTRSASRRTSTTGSSATHAAAAAESAERIATLEAQLADVHAELTALRSTSNQHDQLTADLDAKRDEIAKLRADLHTLRVELDDEHGRSLRFQHEIGELEAQIGQLQAAVADVNNNLDVVTRQRDEYDVRLTQAETQLAKRTRGGGAYEFEKSPVTVSNAASALKQVVSGFARNVLAAPVNKSRQATEVYPKMIKVLREAAVQGSGGGLGYVPSAADAEDEFAWMSATPEGLQTLEAMGNPVVGVSVSTNANVDLTSDDACPWSAFDIRISQAVSMLTAITLHTLYAAFADNPVDRNLRESAARLARSLAVVGDTGSAALDTSFAEWRANAATTALAVAEVYYHASDLKAPGAPKHVLRMELDKVVEDAEWTTFFARVRRVLDVAYKRVGVLLGDDELLSARLNVLIRRFAVLWFMVPAIDPNWVVTFYPTGARAPVAEKFMHETLLEVEDGPGEEDEDMAAVLILLTAVPAVLVRDQEIVISPASGVRIVVPKELVDGADGEASASVGAAGQDVEMGEAEGEAADDSGSDVEFLDVDDDEDEDEEKNDADAQQANGDVSIANMDGAQQLQSTPGFSLASDLQLADRLLQQVQTPTISSGAFSSPPRSASATLDAIIAGTSTVGPSTLRPADMEAEQLLLEFASSVSGPAHARPSTLPSSPAPMRGSSMQPPSSVSRPGSGSSAAGAPRASTPDRRTSFIGSIGSSLMSLVTGSPSGSQNQFQQYHQQQNGSSSQG